MTWWMLLSACVSPPKPDVSLELPQEASSLPWPDLTSAVVVPELRIPEDFGQYRITLDPGHGARNNPGNTGSECQIEEDVTLELAEGLAERLKATGHFDVRLTRSGDQQVSYQRRVRRAQAWGADLFVSVHTDYRGAIETWRPDGSQICHRSEGASGFSVLYSPDGGDALVERRKALARSVARHVASTGIAPFVQGYGDLYTTDDEVGGTYAHTSLKRIYVLRAPDVPSILIEAHNATDLQEVARWRDPSVREAFEISVAGGIVEWLDDAEDPAG